MKKIEIFLNKYMWTISVFLWFFVLLIYLLQYIQLPVLLTISVFLWFFVLLIYLLQYIQLPVWWFVTSIFWINEITKTISLEFTITTIWAIIAFWYWYKKYERDKDIEMIDKYITWKIKMEDISDIGKWEAFFILKKRWHIKDYIFNIINTENKKIFGEYLVRFYDDPIEYISIQSRIKNFLDTDFKKHLNKIITKMIEEFKKYEKEIGKEIEFKWKTINVPKFLEFLEKFFN